MRKPPNIRISLPQRQDGASKLANRSSRVPGGLGRGAGCTTPGIRPGLALGFEESSISWGYGGAAAPQSWPESSRFQQEHRKMPRAKVPVTAPIVTPATAPFDSPLRSHRQQRLAR